MKGFVFVVLFCSGAIISFAQYKEQVAVPEIDARVLDMANLLTLEQKKSIFTLIKDLEAKAGSQIGIVTLVTLNGVAIDEYAKSLANQMALRGKKRDGILIVFALKERQFRTEVSIGLSKIVTNEFSTQVNEAIIAPRFANQNYATGFYNGIKAFKEKIELNKDLIGK